jgi:hypothetical protein
LEHSDLRRAGLICENHETQKFAEIITSWLVAGLEQDDKAKGQDKTGSRTWCRADSIVACCQVKDWLSSKKALQRQIDDDQT